MNSKILFLSFSLIILVSVVRINQTLCQDPGDLVNGNLIQFNDNGAWCWYQDERAVIDEANGVLIIGSDASGRGTGGSSRNGKVEGVLYSFDQGLKQRTIFRNTGCDDHNAPAFLIRPDGQYLTVYADHYDDYSRYRIYNGSSWSAEQLFDWNTIPGGTDFSTTYSNLFYLSAEEKMYNFVRCYARSPNILVSDDQGDTWTYGGLLTEPDVSVGYVNGYFKYSSNGYNRIDFVGTEHHPRDYYTSIYHGYVLDGKSFNSYGILMDSDISDKNAPFPSQFTQVFASNTLVNGITMTRCWTIELQNYGDTIATIFKARANDNELDHRFFYARFDGSSWISTYLCKAGGKLYSSEQDYIGLGALDPKNPNIIYISTPFDPRDDSSLGLHEIFKGVTTDQGETWNWTPVTQHSVRDNLRPIVPSWGDNTALLWMRGTYSSAQNFDMTIVGLLKNPCQALAPMQYIDATTGNTTYIDDSPIVTTGPGSGMGPDDDLWHIRTGFGNNGTVITSSEDGGEDAPVLKTKIKTDGTETYDVWVNFWANPDADWRIRAGQSEDDLQIFRQMACKQVEEGDHSSSITLTGDGNTFLYQAYLGKIQSGIDSTVEIYINDHSIQTGTSGTIIGNEARTWYDGISYSTTLYVTVDPKKLFISDTTGSTAPFIINSNTAWTISCSESWLTLNTISGTGNDTILLTASANEFAATRMTELIVAAGNIEPQAVDIYQTAATPYLQVSDTSLSVAATENSTTGFHIISNSAWEISCSEDWLEADPEIGANNDSITLSASYNPTDTIRESSLYITIGDSIYQKISINQNANPILYTSANALELDAEDSSFVTVNIVSNTDWNLSISEPSWLTASETTGIGNMTITLTASENTGLSERQSNVTVSAIGVNEQIVTVTQNPYLPEYITIDEDVFGIIYPNPVNDMLYGKLNDTCFNIQVYTSDGKQILSTEINNDTFELNMQNTSKGVYIIHITTHDQTFNKMILKQ